MRGGNKKMERRRGNKERKYEERKQCDRRGNTREKEEIRKGNKIRRK